MGEPPQSPTKKVRRREDGRAPARGRDAKKDKTVVFNDTVKTIKVESYKRYNLPEGEADDQTCCSSKCGIF